MTIIYIVIAISGIAGAFVLMNYLSKRKNHITSEEVANVIERFIDGKGTDWEWDDFISSSIYDLQLEKIRERCARLPDEFPPEKPGEYTGEKGRIVLREYIRQLRTGIGGD